MPFALHRGGPVRGLRLSIIQTRPGQLLATVVGATVAFAVPAQAHVKWFAPYIVDAAPQPIGVTLTNVWFWIGIALALTVSLRQLPSKRAPSGGACLRAWTGSARRSQSAQTISCAQRRLHSSWRSLQLVVSI